MIQFRVNIQPRDGGQVLAIHLDSELNLLPPVKTEVAITDEVWGEVICTQIQPIAQPQVVVQLRTILAEDTPAAQQLVRHARRQGWRS